MGIVLGALETPSILLSCCQPPNVKEAVTWLVGKNENEGLYPKLWVPDNVERVLKEL